MSDAVVDQDQQNQVQSGGEGQDQQAKKQVNKETLCKPMFIEYFICSWRCLFINFFIIQINVNCF